MGDAEQATIQNLLQQLTDKNNTISGLETQIENLNQQISELSNRLKTQNDQMIAQNNTMASMAANVEMIQQSVGIKRSSSTMDTDNFNAEKIARVSNSDHTKNNSTQNVGVPSSSVEHDVNLIGVNNNALNTGNNDNTDKGNPNGTSFASVLQKAKKVQPIQLDHMDRDFAVELFAALELRFANKFEIIKISNGSAPKIFADSQETKAAICGYLKSVNVQHNTFAEKGEQRLSFIVRGLNYGSDTQNISKIGCALTENGVVGNIECCRHLTSHMKRNMNDKQSLLYRFTIDPANNTSTISKINTIGGFRVRIEKMQKSLITQCRRCQRFKHTAKSCAFDYRCVQCTHQHQPGECPRLTNKKLPLQCVNCTEIGIKNNAHSANNLGVCEYFKTKHVDLHRKFHTTQQLRNNQQTEQHISTQSLNTGNGNQRTIASNPSNGNASFANSATTTTHTRANNPHSSKRSKRALVQQYRPSINTSSGGKNKNSK